MRIPCSSTAPQWRLASSLRRAVVLLLGLGVALCTSQSWSDSDLAARVKAAYLYNFLLFVQWPDSDSDSPLQVCTWGSGPVNRALAPIVRKKVQGRSIVLQQLIYVSAAADCHLLYINESEESELQLGLALLGHAPVLTVSDIPAFSRRGGMIGFVNQDRRTRLEVNLHKAHVAGLSISSNLLEVAARVYEVEGGGP